MNTTNQENKMSIPIPKLEKSLEMTEETSNGKQWRKQNLSLEIPNRTSSDISPRDFVQIKMPQTPTSATPKKVNFNFSPSSDSRPYEPTSTRGKSSIKNFLPKLSFKYRGGSNPEVAEKNADSIDSIYSRVVTQDKDKSSSISRAWSFSKLFTPRINRTASLPVTRVANSNQDCSARGETAKEVGSISRSLSIPVINKEKRGIQRTNSFFRVVPTTPRSKDRDSEVSMDAKEDDENNEDNGEDIPEEEAVCRICFVELCEGGETLKLECSCKGELALAHQECAVKWFALKGNKTCDVCQQEVLNLPVTLLRIQSAINRNTRATNFRHMEINGYRVWQDLPILVIVSMLAYFCFLEQLLASKMDSRSIAISLPFSCALGLLASMTSSTMVKKRFVWVYASIQFALVVVFAHLFCDLVHVEPLISIFLSTFAGFGVAMSGGIIVVETLKWRARRRGVTNHNETTLNPSQAPE